MEDILIEGKWQASKGIQTFQARNPATREMLAAEYPVSPWADCERALDASLSAAKELRGIEGAQVGRLLDIYADAIEARADELCALANAETALPVKPRLRDVELPRTTTQLRQAAAAAREGSWTQAVIDTKNNIRSHLRPVGTVVVFGPNNFPFAFNGVSGGDFAAAMAAGCPVIAKAHPLHPATSKMLAECAFNALVESGLPRAAVQMIYHLRNEDGLRLVADARVGATSFTGSRAGGMHLKAAADKAGKPIYLEMSSLNPVVFLPGALRGRCDALVGETADSGLAGTGQFCTSPNLLFVLKGAESQLFIEGVAKAYGDRKAGALFSDAALQGLAEGVQRLRAGGAAVLSGGKPLADAAGFCFENTVLRVSAADFVKNGDTFRHEAFGNVTSFVVCDDATELIAALGSLEGNLTGSVYSDTKGEDDGLYAQVAEVLRPKVGRLLNDKMPTGVALSPAMQHGGPYPATGHAGFTSVGISRSIERFGILQCYDSVRPDRLPAGLRDAAPNDEMWRQIDGSWVRG